MAIHRVCLARQGGEVALSESVATREHARVGIHIKPGRQGGKNTGSWENAHLRKLAGLYLDGSESFYLEEDASRAEIVLITDVFYDHHFWKVLFAREHLKRLNHHYVYSEKALISRVLPGLATSIPKRPWDFGRYRAAMYTCHCESNSNACIGYEEPGPSRDFLFSYVGRESHPLRRRIVKTLAGTEGAWVEDSGDYDHWNLEAENRIARQQHYVDIIKRSRFVLCPRGWSPASIRVYEVMACGRVPVIISDLWRPPQAGEGPVWESFSIFVNESELETLEPILRNRACEAAEMGKRARENWEKYFSTQNEIKTLLHSAVELHRSKRFNEYLLIPLWPIFLLAISVHYAGYAIGGAIRSLQDNAG